MKLWDNSYRQFVNLSHREDRRQHMAKELKRMKLHAGRFRAYRTADHQWDMEKVKLMWDRTPGAIGNLYSQMEIIKTALSMNRCAVVLEDDVVFCTDFWERMEIIEDFTDHQHWDIFWLGGTYHIEPTWHKAGHPNSEIHGKCNCDLNCDWGPTANPRIVRTYGCWSTYAYIVNVVSAEKILAMMEARIKDTIGIDHLFIMLQPDLMTFAFNPGCVKQIDGESDIGVGNGDEKPYSKFSGFASLGPHWFQDLMTDNV